MREIGLVTLLSVVVTAAAPAHRPASYVTPKSTQDFASCFVRSQDRAGKAWSFVPRDHGGRFSNLGNNSGAAAYFMVINDRGPRREIELDPVTPSGGQREAVNQCI